MFHQSHLPLHVLALAAILVTSGAANAEPAAEPETQTSQARVLFREGRELAAAGNYQAACPKFAQSLALEVGIGTQFNLADCWEHIGRTASAQALFLGAAASAKAAGQSDREQVLRDRALALEPRLSRLVISVAEPSAELVVERNTLPLQPDAFGKAAVVDPGAYEIIAHAPGKKSYRTTATVAPGAELVTVTIPALEVEPPAVAEAEAPAAVAPPAEAAADVGPVTAPPSLSPTRRGLTLGSATLGAVGVGGLAFGAFMALRFSNKNDDAKNICPSSKGCSTSEIEQHDQLVDDAKGARTLMYVGFAAGSVALGAASLLFFAPSSETGRASAGSWRAAPLIGANELGASVSGQF